MLYILCNTTEILCYHIRVYYNTLHIWLSCYFVILKNIVLKVIKKCIFYNLRAVSKETIGIIHTYIIKVMIYKLLSNTGNHLAVYNIILL